MALFLSFLTVDVVRSEKHLGSYNGWTLLKGADGLEIRGGVVNNIEYLDSLEYKKNLNSVYNNYVNPFYLFDILNEKGKQYFLAYYAAEIDDILQKVTTDAAVAKQKAQAAIDKKNEVTDFWSNQRVKSDG